MKNIVFVGGLFPKEIRNEIEDKSIGLIQYAADALQWAIVNGLDNNGYSVSLVNLPYIGSYPFRYKDYIIKSFKFSHRLGADDINVGFLNFPIYKLYSRYFQLKKTLKKLLLDNNEIILIYAVYTPFIKAAVDLKTENPSIKICLIVPDLPEYMGDSNNYLLKQLKKAEKCILVKLLEKIDAFVLLSEFMHEPLKVGNRPWVRVEGIFNSNKNIDIIEKEKFKTILYSGTLSRRYGILNLIQAFLMIKDVSYRLWICGDGDARDELNQMVKNDLRITYFGQITREEVLILQKKATILVNPRTSEGEFTKYSFPSKTMEYLASGTPCVMYHLEAIPDDYLPFLFFVEKDDVESLRDKLIEVCNKPEEYLRDFGAKASEFILNNKNPKIQVKKICDMLFNL